MIRVLSGCLRAAFSDMEAVTMNGDVIRIAVISDTHGLLRRCVVRELQDCSVILFL